jgi:hypothetical protein
MLPKLDTQNLWFIRFMFDVEYLHVMKINFVPTPATRDTTAVPLIVNCVAGSLAVAVQHVYQPYVLALV